MRRVVLAVLVLVSCLGLSSVAADDGAGTVADEPKPWPQYAANAAHTGVAFDTWDYEQYDEIAWEMNLRCMKGWNRNPVVGMGKLVIGDTDAVRCVDVISGKTLWSLSLNDACSESCTMLSDIVVVPLQESFLGVNLANGEIMWHGSSGGSHMSSVAALKEDETIWGYFSAYSKGGAVRRISLDPLKSGWETRTEYAVVGAPGVNDVEGYVGCAAHYEVKLLAEGYGGVKDSYKMSTQVWAPTVAFDEYMIFTMSGGEIIVLPKPREVSDAQIIDVGMWTFHGPSVYGDSLVIGNNERRMVRFDIKGNIIWDVRMPGPITDAITVMGDELLVPVGNGSEDGTGGVYIVSAEDASIIKHIPLDTPYVFQPVVAWKRMFVEYGENEKYKARKLACFGKKPRPADMEPKLRVKDGDFDVRIPYRGETVKQVELFNEGKVDLDLMFEGDLFLSSTISTLNLKAGEDTTLRVKVSAGNARPGKYTGKLGIYIDDGEYGIRNLGYVTADITVTEKEEEIPKEEPPNPPINVKATWVYDHVEVDWDAPTTGAEATGYNIFRALEGEDLPKTPYNNVSIKETFYKDTEVERGKTYIYALVSLASGGLESDLSDTASVYVPQKLVAVENLAATFVGDKVLLTWTSEQSVEFLIQCNGEDVGRTTDLHFTHENPPPGTLIYKVFPTDGDKIGPEAHVIIEFVVEPPEPVSDLKYQIIGDSVLLVWSYDGEAEFIVTRDGVEITKTDELYFKDNSPKKTKMTYTVVAFVNGQKSSPVSVVVDLTPAPDAPDAVTGLDADVTSSTILVYWHSSGDGISYIVKRNGVVLTVTADTFYADTTFEADTLIEYEVIPTKGGVTGGSAKLTVDLRKKSIEVVFTIGKPTATVNGVEMDCKGTPFVSGVGRTMVPFRFLGESIGAKVDYTLDEVSGGVKTVSYVLDGKSIVLTIGSKTAIVAGFEIELDAAPMIRDGRTYVPLRFVTDALGGEVSWNSMKRQATIKFDS